jgi:predicted nuclease with TOPRIM domain
MLQKIPVLDEQISQTVQRMTLAEKGVNIGEIAERIKTLQLERSNLEIRIERLNSIKPTRGRFEQSIDETVKFFERFEHHFECASISERKNLMRQVIDRIVIDRKRRVAQCYLLAIPRSNSLSSPKISTTHISGVPPTRFELVFQA